MGLGVVLAETGEMSVAATHFEHATESCPGNPEAFRNLCWAELELGEPGAAQSTCIKALALDPEHLEARILLDRARVELARRDATLREYARQARAEPGNAEPRLELCIAHRSFGDLNVARQWCEEAVRIAPRWRRARFAAAQVADSLLDARTTASHCQELLKLDADDGARGWCLVRLRALDG